MTSIEVEGLRERFLRLETPQDVAEILGVRYDRLVWHIYKSPPANRYAVFELPKASGGTRKIMAPVTALKLIQRELNKVLQQVYQPRRSVNGFTSGRSIVTNARSHTGKKFVFNLDLRDFFPSINFGRVRGMFIASPYNLDPSVATVLARICCHDNQLPQGAPTSPVISNMICAKMDSELQRLAATNNCWYSRYADDLTFSTSVARFPRAIATSESDDYTSNVVVGRRLDSVIKNNGFRVNEKKVRLRLKNSRQEVTGLTVNQSPNVKREFVRQIRAMLNAWEKWGLDSAEKEYWNKFDKKSRNSFKDHPRFRDVVRGKIEFLGMVRNRDALYQKYRDWFKKLNNDIKEIS